LQVPGSKSYSQRALVIASLVTEVDPRNTLVSEDTRHLVRP
jgi:5-enolpyruvylshikimate-3-phosphate synthase